MEPLGYLMHGHPLCPRCFDGDYRRDDTGDPADAEPWPNYAGDEFVDIDPATFAFTCDACNTHGITPRMRGGINDLGHCQAA